MTWFSLPITQPDNRAAFADADGAAAWLARQPQANAPAMQAELARQVQWLNGWTMPARERFKTLEALRKAIFAADAECLRRFDNRPLPLAAGEQALLDTSRRLWRACAVGYLHCLRACLDGDPSLAAHAARVAHRAVTSLRMEQASGYAGGSDPAGDFWRTLHAVLASAERLGVARAPVSDRRLGETTESSVGGQYAMILLLHLARPFELSRGQFAAAGRWFARWREQAAVLDAPDDSRKGHCAALDLAQDNAIHEHGAAAIPRWLALSGVLRKMRQRLEALAAGDTPEHLKLGGGLSAEACTALLNILADNLRNPLPPPRPAPPGAPELALLSGVESIYRQLGGKDLKPTAAGLLGDRRMHEQIVLFGHAARAGADDAEKPETWRIVREEGGVLHLCRSTDGGTARLGARALLAIRRPGETRYVLANIGSLHTASDGTLHAMLRMLPGKARTLVAEIRERVGGKLSRHPALLLPAVDAAGAPPSVVLPAGLPARAQSIELHGDDGTAIRLDARIEHGSDYERWTCTAG